MRSALDMAATLLEWTDEERGRYEQFYAQHKAKLEDMFEVGGYTLALWRYPDENIVEVVISLGDLDWTDPEVQQARHPGSNLPMHAIAKKLREWLERYGHLAVGSQSGRKISMYKRMFSRIFPYAKIVDLAAEVPGGGEHFFVIDKDKDVMSRVQVEGLEKDFIKQNPIPYRLQPLSPDIWEIYAIRDKGEERVGKLYYDLDVPETANQFWRDNPWMVVPEKFSAELQAFPTQEQAINWVIHLK